MSKSALYALPSGWEWTTLGEICEIVRTQVNPQLKPKETFNYLSIENVGVESGELVNFIPTIGEKIKSAKIAFSAKDILYSKLRPYLNKVHLPSFDGISATDLIPIRPLGGILREYVGHYLRTRYVVEYANQRMRGIQLPRIPVEDLLQLPVPLAPLAEQARIIRKLDPCLMLIRAAQRVLDRLPPLLTDIRQSVVYRALRGNLTARHPNDEPADQLLKRISVEVEKFRKNVAESCPIDDPKLTRLPPGWIWTRLGDISLVITKGATPTSYGFEYVETGVAFVKVENLANGCVDRKSITQYVTDRTHEFLKRSQLAENDVLFSIAGTIGKVAVVQRDDLPANTNQAIAIIRCPWHFVDPHYLRVMLESSIPRLSLEEKPRGVAMNNISLKDVANILSPLPPLSEQKRIVSKVNEIFLLMDEVGSRVETALKSSDILRHTILDMAFRGKLVSHDPNDESTSALLNRIRVQRTSMRKGRKDQAFLEIACPTKITPKA